LSGKVLITGGAGFIGGHLARTLVAANWRVDILENFQRAVEDEFLGQMLESPGVRLLRADLTDAKICSELDDDYDIIFHLSAIIGVRHVLENAFAVLADNVQMTANALGIARRQKNLVRFMFASTSEVTAGSLIHLGDDYPIPTPETVPLTLTALDHPRTSYMLSKIYSEAMCHQSGLSFTIFRPHNVYGPRMGMAHVVPEMLKRAYGRSEGHRFEVPSTEHRRAFCYYEDAIEMLIRLMQTSGAEGNTYNIGNQENEISIGELAKIITSVVGRDIEITPLPATPGSPSRRCPDMSNTVKTIGFSPRVGIEDGISRTFKWYRQNVFSGQGLTAQ
jgi:UDP-glucose 4-epimerase